MTICHSEFVDDSRRRKLNDKRIANPRLRMIYRVRGRRRPRSVTSPRFSSIFGRLPTRAPRSREELCAALPIGSHFSSLHPPAANIGTVKALKPGSYINSRGDAVRFPLIDSSTTPRVNLRATKRLPRKVFRLLPS